MKWCAWALVLAASASSPVFGQDREWVQTPQSVPLRLVEVGTWDFSATKEGPDGKPECFEAWTFNSDGSGEIASGEQRVSISWEARYVDGFGQFVFVVDQSSNDGPDCMGRASDPKEYPQDERSFKLMFYGEGQGALVCTGGELLQHPDGTSHLRMDMKHCWGRITAPQEA